MTSPGQLSSYLLPGRTSEPGDVIAQARDAEEAGFDAVWISERLDMKEIGVLVGAAIAATSRVRIGAGVTHLGTRNAVTLSALAATAQTMSGGRFALGLGRGMPGMQKRLGIPRSGLAALGAYPEFLRALWRGDRVVHNGPLGSIDRARFTDAPLAPMPPLYLATIGEQGFATAARAYDGVLLHPLLSPAAVSSCVDLIRKAGVGRDLPLRVVATVLTSPGLDTETTDEIILARALTYLQIDALGEAVVRLNEWDPAVLAGLREELSPGGTRRFADMHMTRRELSRLAVLVPDEWVRQSCAVGSAQQCAARITKYWAAGADEVLVHGALPGQSRELVRCLRPRQEAA